jgi:hypothetical protein
MQADECSRAARFVAAYAEKAVTAPGHLGTTAHAMSGHAQRTALESNNPLKLYSRRRVLRLL